tara:strand:+ start:427 stop:1206 length:780 start_codon:yes stop_codon:yes gene_type:complete
MNNLNNSSKLRIVSDYLDFEKNRPEDIYFYMNKKNVFQNYALIIGPKNTPYFGGYYIFEVIFPENYPESSPKLKLLTVDGKVRFNPNLYECGKVCLSILGTWNGPGWTNVMTLRTVLISIQSLMGEFPLRNEPGLEEVKENDIRNIYYNNFLNYYNLELATINILNNLMKKNTSKESKSNNPKFVMIKEVKYFKDIILENFKKNYEDINNQIKSLQIILGEIEFDRIVYFLPSKVHLDFVSLNEEYDLMFQKLKKMNLY